MRRTVATVVTMVLEMVLEMVLLMMAALPPRCDVKALYRPTSDGESVRWHHVDV